VDGSCCAATPTLLNSAEVSCVWPPQGDLIRLLQPLPGCTAARDAMYPADRRHAPCPSRTTPPVIGSFDIVLTVPSSFTPGVRAALRAAPPLPRVHVSGLRDVAEDAVQFGVRAPCTCAGSSWSWSARAFDVHTARRLKRSSAAPAQRKSAPGGGRGGDRPRRSSGCPHPRLRTRSRWRRIHTLSSPRARATPWATPRRVPGASHTMPRVRRSRGHRPARAASERGACSAPRVSSARPARAPAPRRPSGAGPSAAGRSGPPSGVRHTASAVMSPSGPCPVRPGSVVRIRPGLWHDVEDAHGTGSRGEHQALASRAEARRTTPRTAALPALSTPSRPISARPPGPSSRNARDRGHRPRARSASSTVLSDSSRATAARQCGCPRRPVAGHPTHAPNAAGEIAPGPSRGNAVPVPGQAAGTTHRARPAVGVLRVGVVGRGRVGGCRTVDASRVTTHADGERGGHERRDGHPWTDGEHRPGRDRRHGPRRPGPSVSMATTVVAHGVGVLRPAHRHEVPWSSASSAVLHTRRGSCAEGTSRPRAGTCTRTATAPRGRWRRRRRRRRTAAMPPGPRRPPDGSPGGRRRAASAASTSTWS
jgi:hypothetical protein